MSNALSTWRCRSVAIGLAAAALCAGAYWTLDGKTCRLYCTRCGAVRKTTDFEIFGVWFSASDEIHKTRLSRWIEAHRYPDCTHRWTAGYADGLWSRSCHRGNLVDRLAAWGDDATLLEAINHRQGEDPAFVDCLVDSLGDYDAASHNFLASVLFEDSATQAAAPAFDPPGP